MEVAIYKDDVWEQVANTKKLTCDQKREKAFFVTKLSIPDNGKQGDSFRKTFETPRKPTIWFFVALDCEHNLHSKVRSMPKIDLEVRVMGENGQSHFSYEESGSLQLHLWLLLVFVLMFGTTIYSYTQYYKEYGKTESPHFLIMLALFIHIGAIFFQFLHLWMYSSNGRGIPILDIFSLIGNMLSDITLSCLLIMIA